MVLVNKLTFTISEYGLLGLDEAVKKYNSFLSVKLPEENGQKIYNEFEAFAKTDYGKDILGFAGNGKYLQAKNYVGTIQTKNGCTLEILPKIYNFSDEKDEPREIFLELLRLLYKLPNYKHVERANFKNEKMPLLEIFITMFLIEVGAMIKKGIKSDYINQEDNLYFLKGKFLINQQLKYNYIHKERFFVSYDEYSPNRAENRLIKSTLKYLSKISKSYENIRLIRLYQESMFNIEHSLNFDADFRACKTETRGMNHYKTLLIWSKIFLKKESFSSFSGDTIAFAILYPMEKLFENYVEHYLIEKNLNLHVINQSAEKRFVSNDSKKKLFGVRPDFVIKDNDIVKVVADAKWKLLSKKHSFSQSDFYQLFAYNHIYTNENKQCIGLRLYYPMSEYLDKKKEFTYFDGTKIQVIPLDMKDIVRDEN